VLASVFTGAVLLDGLNLDYEQPAVAKVAKYCGTCGIGTFIKHHSPRRFLRQPAMRKFRSSRVSCVRLKLDRS
jgi:hypothetical protein